ncbi:hypothetical protein [Chitinophaga sp. S165]|uniref:hypothetical protein n=1 Tax=Chitinophaga sp. S165 TaxID=2135462 RepID=UPI0011B824DF|nr:hypothetical protein [Chitinophaga sp. S165]
MIVVLLGLLSFSSSTNDIQKFYKNGLELIKQKKYKEANTQLLQALSVRRHPQILFWISYSYAALKEKDSCQFYFDQILNTPPQPMSAFYVENVPKIKYWIDNSSTDGVIFNPTLNKKRRDSLVNLPEYWGLSAENMKDQMKRIYNNSLKSISIPVQNDSLPLP